MEILNLLPFVKTSNGDIGYAQQGTFAASAWLISDEAFNSIGGNKFSWIAPDGGYYMDDISIFTRPTIEEVINNISERLKEKAIEKGYIKD